MSRRPLAHNICVVTLSQVVQPFATRRQSKTRFFAAPSGEVRDVHNTRRIPSASPRAYHTFRKVARVQLKTHPHIKKFHPARGHTHAQAQHACENARPSAHAHSLTSTLIHSAHTAHAHGTFIFCTLSARSWIHLLHLVDALCQHVRLSLRVREELGGVLHL